MESPSYVEPTRRWSHSHSQPSARITSSHGSAPSWISDALAPLSSFLTTPIWEALNEKLCPSEPPSTHKVINNTLVLSYSFIVNQSTIVERNMTVLRNVTWLPTAHAVPHEVDLASLRVEPSPTIWLLSNYRGVPLDWYHDDLESKEKKSESWDLAR